jgi:GNAT superfamily N-acetyltransferase
MKRNQLRYPVVTPEVTTRVESCSIAFWAEKVEALRTISGNPYGACTQQFGGVTALLTASADNLDFNRVGNMSENDMQYLDAICAWYRDRGRLCRFEITPTQARRSLLQSLTEKGFYHSGFYTALYGVPEPLLEPDPAITVRDVLLNERDLFAEIYLESFGIPRLSELSYLREGVRLLVGKPSMRCLFALDEGGIPVAMAILYLYRRVGYLATAATLPTMRGRGYHQTLLYARLALAADAGCDLIAAQAAFASQSQQNMERTGLCVAYTKAFWTAREV